MFYVCVSEPPDRQVKKVIAEQGTWKVVLPGLGAQLKSEDSEKESNTLY
jgi:hypothetical protein